MTKAPDRSSCSARCRPAATPSWGRTAPARRSAGKRPSLQIAKRQLEAYVPVGDAWPRIVAVLREEADVEDVLVGADLGHAGRLGLQAHAQHLRRLAAEHLLVRAERGIVRLRLSRFPQDRKSTR